MIPAGGNHPLAFFDIQGHWFFAQDVFAGFCGRDCLFGMKVNRRGDIDGINVVRSHEFTPVGKPLSSTEPLCKRLRQIAAAASDCNEFALGQVPQRRRYTFNRNVPATN